MTARARTTLWVTALSALFTLTLTGCQFTGHPTTEAELGAVRPSADLLPLLGKPGPVVLETVIAADWEVTRSGLINLDHPKAKAAGLEDVAEPIHIFFHALRHPERGLFLVDSGVEAALGDPDEAAAIRGVVAWFMKTDAMLIRNDTASWLARQEAPLSGVFMTHLHLDHVSGLPDVPNDIPIYAGPGETRGRSIENLVVRPTIDRALEGKSAIREWAYEVETNGLFEGAIDIFADGSVWALHVPGHTPGSTAYLVRTPNGPVLLVGDASHTAWGWQQGVEPGTFSSDQPRSAESLAKLRNFSAQHPEVEIRLGHQLHHGDPATGRLGLAAWLGR